MMLSRRLWMGLILGIVLGFVLSTLFVPWAGLLVQPDHGQHGSPVAADNGKDISYLQDTAAGQDHRILICDHSVNGERAVGRAWNNGNIVQTVYDRDGAGGDCWSEPVGLNAGGHDACLGRAPAIGCGPISDHGS